MERKMWGRETETENNKKLLSFWKLGWNWGKRRGEIVEFRGSRKALYLPTTLTSSIDFTHTKSQSMPWQLLTFDYLPFPQSGAWLAGN